MKINCSNIVFGVIYRHPSKNTKLFLEQLKKNLELLNNAKLYLIGDLNINICSFNENFSNDAIDYVNMLASNSFFPIISLPTRVTDTSAKLIDHIIINDCKNSIFPGIIKTDLSDHYPIFCTIYAAARNRTSNNKSTVKSRYFKEISLILIAIYLVITCMNRFVSFFRITVTYIPPISIAYLATVLI